MTDGPFYLGSFKCSRYLVSRFPQSSFQVYGCISTHPFVGTRGSDRSPLKHRLTLNHIFDSPVRRRPRGVSGQRRNRFAGPANAHGQRRCDLPVVRQRSDRRWRLVRATDRGDLQNPNVRDGRFQQIRRHRREGRQSLHCRRQRRLRRAIPHLPSVLPSPFSATLYRMSEPVERFVMSQFSPSTTLAIYHSLLSRPAAGYPRRFIGRE